MLSDEKLRFPAYNSLFPTVVVDKFAEQMGVEPYIAIGDGLQGEVFALDCGRMMKLTESVADAALSLYLKDNPHPIFPEIDNVEQITVRGRKIFGIVRSDVESIFEGLEFDVPNERKDALIRYWYFLRHGPDHWLQKTREEMQGDDELMLRADQLKTLWSELQIFNKETGFDVSDINLPNLGVLGDRVIIRDFGMNSICHDIVKSMRTNRLSGAPTHSTYGSSFPTEFIEEICSEIGIAAEKSLGSGDQGEAILLQDGSVIKITPVQREAALALYLQENDQAQLPKVLDVKRFEFNGKPHYAIHREQIDNFIPDDSSLIETIEVEADLARCWTSLLSGTQSTRFLVDFYLEGKPEVRKLFNLLADFREGILIFNEETGIDVEDYNFSNLGLVNGKIVLRDFGMNYIRYDLLNEQQLAFLAGEDITPSMRM